MWSGNVDEVSNILLSGLSSGVLSFEAVERKLPEAVFLAAPLAASTSSAKRLCCSADVPPTWRARCLGIPRPAPVRVPSDARDGPGSAALAPSAAALGRRAEYDWADDGGSLRSAATSPPGPGTAGLAADDDELAASSAPPALLCLAPIVFSCCFSLFTSA